MRILYRIDMKRFIVLILALALILMFGGCMTPQEFNWKPCNQPNTEWISEDGSISFFVDENCKAVGTMKVNDEIHDIGLYNEPQRGVGMHIYLSGELHVCEKWLCKYESEKEFVAVIEETTFFEKGQKFKFYRLNE